MMGFNGTSDYILFLIVTYNNDGTMFGATRVETIR